jgi:hypothetical protein
MSTIGGLALLGLGVAIAIGGLAALLIGRYMRRHKLRLRDMRRR